MKKRLTITAIICICVLSLIFYAFHFFYQSGEKYYPPSADNLSKHYSDELIFSSYEKISSLLNDDKFIDEYKLNGLLNDEKFNKESYEIASGYIIASWMDFDTSKLLPLSEVVLKTKEDVIVLRLHDDGSFYCTLFEDLYTDQAIPTIIYQYKKNRLNYDFWLCLDENKKWEMVHFNKWYRSLPITDEEMKTIDEIFNNDFVTIFTIDGEDVTDKFKEKFRVDYSKDNYDDIQKELTINEYSIIVK